jgi:hypothetical protein
MVQGQIMNSTRERDVTPGNTTPSSVCASYTSKCLLELELQVNSFVSALRTSVFVSETVTDDCQLLNDLTLLIGFDKADTIGLVEWNNGALFTPSGLRPIDIPEGARTSREITVRQAAAAA